MAAPAAVRGVRCVCHCPMRLAQCKVTKNIPNGNASLWFSQAVAPGRSRLAAARVLALALAAGALCKIKWRDFNFCVMRHPGRRGRLAVIKARRQRPRGAKRQLLHRQTACLGVPNGSFGDARKDVSPGAMMAKTAVSALFCVRFRAVLRRRICIAARKAFRLSELGFGLRGSRICGLAAV